MTLISSRVREELLSDDVEGSPERIKHLVASAIESVDDTAEITFTSYFANTYTPDLVMRWPSVSKVERLVFLRTAQRSDWLAEDVSFIPMNQSLMIPLDEVDEVVGTGGESIQYAAQARSVFVGDLGAIEELGSDGRASVELYGSALLRGGIGYLDEADVDGRADSIAGSFLSAQRAEVEGTAQGLGIFDSSLLPAEQHRLGEVLKALWIGGGGVPSTFPSDREFASDLDSLSLRFLLTNRDLLEASFWARLANVVTLPALLGVGKLADDSGLQDLMRHAVEKLLVRAATATPTADRGQGYRWKLDSGRLLLSAPTHLFEVADASLPPSTDDESPITSQTLQRRFKDWSYPILEVSATDGEKNLTLRGTLGDLSDFDSGAFDSLLADGATVAEVLTELPSGRRLRIEPSVYRAQTKSRGKVHVDEILFALAALGTDMDSIEVTNFKEFLTG